MPSFIRTEKGLLSASVVTSVVRSHAGRAVLYFGDGDSMVSEDPYEEVSASLGPVVPDNTGCVGLQFVVDDLAEIDAPVDDAVLVFKYPIVAWRITPNGAVPILSSDREPTHILHPDGTVYGLLGSDFADLKSALKDFRAHAG